jgi:hypothetical protein
MPLETPSPDSSRTKRRWPTWARVFLGAGIGCFALAILLVVALAVTLWWAMTPGEQGSPPAFVGDDTIAVIATSSPGSDEGMNALLVQTISEFHRVTWERIPDDEAPFFFRFIRGMQRRQIESGRAGRKLATSMPKDLALLVVRRPDAPPTWLAVVNLAKGPRMYGFFLEFLAKRSPEVEAISHRGETIVRFPDAPAFCFVESTFLAAEDIEVLERAIDRYHGPGTATPDLARRISKLESEWDIVGVFDNSTGELTDAMRSAALFLVSPEGGELPVDLGDRELADPVDPDRWDAVVETEVGIDVVDASSMRVEIDVTFDDAEAAVATLPRIERMLTGWAEAFDDSGLEISPTLEQRGPSVRVILRLQGVDVALTEGFEALLDETNAPAPQGAGS